MFRGRVTLTMFPFESKTSDPCPDTRRSLPGLWGPRSPGKNQNIQFPQVVSSTPPSGVGVRTPGPEMFTSIEVPPGARFVSRILNDPVIRNRPSVNSIPNSLLVKVSTPTGKAQGPSNTKSPAGKNERMGFSAVAAGTSADASKYHSCRKCEETSHCLLLSSLVPSRKQPHLHKDRNFHSTLSLSPCAAATTREFFYNLAAIVSMRRCPSYLRIEERRSRRAG